MYRTSAASIVLLACLGAAPAGAQDYPSRPIRLLVPLGAGGLGDTFARTLSQHLSPRLGQPLLVENRPGANQTIALDLTAKAAPDGHTLLQSTQAGLVFATAMRKNLPYDPLKDFSQIGLLFTTPFYLLAHPSVPARNVQELVAHVKANPRKLNFASIGVGSGHHLSMEFLMMRTGMEMVHVPYKGSDQAMPDIYSGRVQVMFQGPNSSLPAIRSGKLRGLGIAARERNRSVPEVPTIAEQGVAGFYMDTWFGLTGPAGLPRDIVTRLNAESNQFLRLPAVIEKFAASFLEYLPSTPEQMAQRVRDEIPLWVKVVQQAKIEIE
ncbi:MAG: tripartite tricarboxylate transporter substrate binding protein [Burkholderiales bacterium]|nr:tripartite tricarboxylate transporter substrate binding protein [Burkholderiales bacterium]